MGLVDPDIYRQASKNYVRGVHILPNLCKTVLSTIHLDTLSAQWSSAANPCSTSAIFAVGSTEEVFVLKQGEAQWHQSPTHHARREIFSVDWLDENVIISGDISGDVGLWDTRSNGSSMRFKYPSKIHHARKLNIHQIAVAGIHEAVNRFNPFS